MLEEEIARRICELAEKIESSGKCKVLENVMKVKMGNKYTVVITTEKERK
jgi:hypothetical protein